MGQSEEHKGQAGLKAAVLDQHLCTGCAACVDLCPYLKHYRDHTVVLHECDRAEGRCHAYCPRTPTDLQELQEALFEPADLTAELGAVKGLYLTRAGDPKIRAAAQHGGTVSALVSLALEQGIIEQAVLASQSEGLLAEGCLERDAPGTLRAAGSKFTAAPIVAMFNRASREGPSRLGVVATPCQALALAKMRVNPAQSDRERMNKLRLLIGLFCGWALDWRKLRALLADKIGSRPIVGLDIPPSKHGCLEVYLDDATVEIPIAEVNQCVRQSCRYCFDMTCEFADLSVGSARSEEGWSVDKGWNQVLVRSAQGQKLLDLARQKGTLEFKEVPAGNLAKLKAASLNKKRACLANLRQKTGVQNDLIYLDCNDPVVRLAEES